MAKNKFTKHNRRKKEVMIAQAKSSIRGQFEEDSPENKMAEVIELNVHS